MNRKHNTEHDALREAALSQSQKRYMGPPCKHGHDGERFTSNRCCVHCTPKVRAARQPDKPKLRTEHDPRYSLYRAAKHRAKTKGRDFDLDIEDIVIPDVCPVLGIPMTSPSLDRKENHLGYTKANTRVISHRANTLKSSATIEELEKILDYMRSPD